MCCRQAENNKVSRIDERFLDIIYGDENFAYQQLLDKKKCLAIHQQNLKVFATEMFKNVKCSAPSTFNE